MPNVLRGGGLVIASLALALLLATHAHAGVARAVVVRGRVLNPDGTPVAGAQVAARGTFSVSATTDDHGRYTLQVPIGSPASLARGPFQLEIRAERAGRKLPYAGGGALLAFDVTLLPGGARVRVRSNSPLATGALVTAFEREDAPTAFIEAEFGGTGHGAGTAALKAVDDAVLPAATPAHGAPPATRPAAPVATDTATHEDTPAPAASSPAHESIAADSLVSAAPAPAQTAGTSPPAPAPAPVIREVPPPASPPAPAVTPAREEPPRHKLTKEERRREEAQREGLAIVEARRAEAERARLALEARSLDSARRDSIARAQVEADVERRRMAGSQVPPQAAPPPPVAISVSPRAVRNEPRSDERRREQAQREGLAIVEARRAQARRDSLAQEARLHEYALRDSIARAKRDALAARRVAAVLARRQKQESDSLAAVDAIRARELQIAAARVAERAHLDSVALARAERRRADSLAWIALHPRRPAPAVPVPPARDRDPKGRLSVFPAPAAPPPSPPRDTCFCSLRGTIEIEWENRPLERGLQVGLSLAGPVQRNGHVEMNMGAPREFRFEHLPCGDYELTVRALGRLHYQLASGDSLVNAPCHGGTEMRVVLVPVRR